jgi:hypothetical protein
LEWLLVENSSLPSSEGIKECLYREHPSFVLHGILICYRIRINIGLYYSDNYNGEYREEN